MFGNPTVMPVKILWDYLMYWSITGYIFMHDRMCEQMMYLRSTSKLSRLSKLSHFMQDFFRQWHAATADSTSSGLINISGIPIIREMNAQLLDDLSSGEYHQRFAANLAQLETLCCEIVEQSGLDIDNPFRSSSIPAVRHDAFDAVFNPAERPGKLELMTASG